MNIFNNDLTPEENSSLFTVSEVDNESFAIEQLGGVYPEEISEINPDFVLNSMNEDRGKWQIEAGYDSPTDMSPASTPSAPAFDEESTETLEEADYTELADAAPEGTIAEAETGQPGPSAPAVNEEFPDMSEDDEEIQTETLEEADYTELADAAPAEIAEETPADSREADQSAPTVNEKSTDIIEPTATESDDFTEVRAAEPPIEEVPDSQEEEITPVAEEVPVPKVSSIEDVFNMEKDIEDGAAGATKLGKDYVPSVEIDDALRSLMQDDLAAEAANIVEVTPEEMPPPPVAEEEKPEASFMQIEEEKVDKKDTPAEENAEDKDDNNSEELSWDSETDEIITNQKTKKNKNTADKKKTNTLDPKDTDMTEEEEKTTTKKFALILVIVAVVMILIIGGVIGYLYLSNKGNLAPAPVADTTAVHKPDSLATKPLDTTTHEADTTAVADSAVAKLDKPKPADTEPKVAPPPPPKPRVVPPPKPATRPKTTTAKPRATTPAKNNNTAKPQPPASTTAVYSIQMYSSPSRADAEERLALLANRNITGYISTQQIKGQTWYRVRFGRYASYEEAAAEVSRLGLQDAWIERIK